MSVPVSSFGMAAKRTALTEKQKIELAVKKELNDKNKEMKKLLVEAEEALSRGNYTNISNFSDKELDDFFDKF